MKDGQALKRCREIMGLTQFQLAVKAKVDVRRIQNYEQGIRDINKAECITVLHIADALNVNVRDILNEE